MRLTEYRRVVLVSLDWIRPKDPRIPLGHASLVASLLESGDLEVCALSRAINEPSFEPSSNLEAICELARDFDPSRVDVAIGAYVWNEATVQSLLGALRQRGFRGRIILGGPQISYAPGGLEELYPQCDVFIRGPGEQVLREVVKTRAQINANGVHYSRTHDRSSVATAELAMLPSPFTAGVIPVFSRSFLRWESQRGCPYRCSFCQHREPGQRLKNRRLPAKRLREEIELFANRCASDIAVLDPIFNLGEHALDVLGFWRDVEFSGRLSFQCRFETLSEEFLDPLAGLNVRLEFGLQTIHEAEGRAIGRPNDVVLVERGIAEILARNIPFEVSLIYGLPLQTPESFEQTVRWCTARGVPVLKAFPLMLLRGTGLDLERSTWGLVESDDEIPVVVESHTFDREGWRRMHAIAASLDGP